MKCNYCGADNKEGSKFCASCGAELTAKKETAKKEEKIEKVEVKTEPVKKDSTDKVTDGKATASLVLGICSFVIFCLSFPLSLIGLILGIASKERSGKRTAGIVLNAIALALATIVVIISFWFGAVISAAVDEYQRTGGSRDFFDIIEEELEKAEEAEEKYEDIKKDVEKEIEKETAKDVKVVGDERRGYVEVPKSWVPFTDVDNPSVYQYTDIGEKGYIITLQTYDEDIDKYTAAKNIMNHIKEEGNEASYKYTFIGKYTAYVVNAKYTDGTYLDAYLFKADDNKLHYISIEGPDNSSDNFDIPKTFKLTK